MFLVVGFQTGLVGVAADEAPPPAASRPAWTVELARANKLCEDGDYPGALELLKSLERRYPRVVEIKEARAAVYARQQDWKLLEQVLSPCEGRLSASGLCLLADAYTWMGDSARAVKLLRRGLKRLADNEELWLGLIDRLLAEGRSGSALEEVERALARLGGRPSLHFRAARAYFALGQALGKTRVMRVKGGRAGQFHRQWLLVEQRDGPEHFLCCPRESALYSLRRALDGGLDDSAADRLHARIWRQVGRPEIGLMILQSREARIGDAVSEELLVELSELSLASGRVEEFLRYARMHADRESTGGERIMFEAYCAAAEQYNQRGDEVLAREFLRRALKHRPGDVGVMLRLADALWETNERESAGLWYRRVLQREPLHAERARILGRLE